MSSVDISGSLLPMGHLVKLCAQDLAANYKIYALWIRTRTHLLSIWPINKNLKQTKVCHNKLIYSWF